MGLLSSALAVSNLLLVPFGSVTELLKNENPWHGFDAQESVLWVVRVQEFQAASCSNWAQALVAEPLGIESASFTSPEKKSKWNAWETWEKKDLEAVTDCKSFPCSVKLNESEVGLLAAAPSNDARMDRFQSVVATRAVRYQKTLERKEYEFPGDPVDPWLLLEKRGFVSSLPRPKIPGLGLRKLAFAPDKIQTIRQVLDRRAAKNATGTEAAVWVRDAYTDHYFDGWGEWVHFSCHLGTGNSNQVILTQALVLEFDLLKKTDLISRLMRGKMKSAIEENGFLYLDRMYEKIRKLALQQMAAPAAK